MPTTANPYAGNLGAPQNNSNNSFGGGQSNFGRNTQNTQFGNSAFGSNPAANTGQAGHTQFGNSNRSVYQTGNLQQELIQNSQTRGAFGNWGQQVSSANQPVQPTGMGQNPGQPMPLGPGGHPNPANQPGQFNQQHLVQPYPQPQPAVGYSPGASHQASQQTPNHIGTSQSPFPAFHPNLPNPGQVRPNQPVQPFGQPFNNQQTGQQNIPRNPNLPANPQQQPATYPNQNPNQNFRQTPPQPTLIAPSKQDMDYLKTLDPIQLRKEVMKQEVEIQRTLIESEKSYRQGVSTIRDLISPSSIKINSAYLEIGTKLSRSFFVLTYPRVITSGWLESMVNADLAMDLSIFIYPQDSSKVLRELRQKTGKIQASLSLNQEKGGPRDPALETAYRDVEGLRDAIQQGVEKFYRVGVYVTVYADTLDALEKSSQVVEGMLSQQSIITKRAAIQMDDGFNATLPLMKDDLYVFNNMNTSPLSACFPFVSSELSSDSGILYGINRHNSSLIIFDRFELENANSLVFATSGAGKSYTVKLEILRSLMIGVNVIVIDPEQEYKVLADTLGGTYVNFSLNSSNRINPFDLAKPLPGESNADILRTSIIDIMGLMNLMLGKLNPEEVSIMERAVQEAYSKRDITPEADFNKVTPPTMSDLVEILNGIVGGESLAQRLYRYTEGTFAGIFNQRTNVNINNNFVVFNIRDLQEQLRPIAMYVLLKYVWNAVRSELKRRILAIDEAWILMQYEDSARFLYGLVKRARKYYLGVTTITQDVGDFLNSPFGKPIVTNAAMKVLLKQSTAAIDQIAETFALTSGEKQVLTQSNVGQGIFFAGPRHVAIEIIAFPQEHKIITSNPKDLLNMQKFMQE